MKTTLFLLAHFLGTSESFQSQQPFSSKHKTERFSTVANTAVTQANNDDPPESVARRNIFESLAIASSSLLLPQPAHAQLVQFPCKHGLMNTYHFMRAGESLLEEDHLLGTNPLFLTNRENGLSTLGQEQAHQAAKLMEEHGVNPSLVKFSLAANAMDTADIVANDLHIGRNRLVPEYTYMDQRGVGRWDMLDLQSTQEAVWALDVHEAGDEGLGGRPPSHDDGTPNETLANQVTRLRQLISLLETSLSGDDILLVFPDGTSPALLSALIAGIPLSRVHEIQYQPGEMRFNINYDTVRASWPSPPSEEYTTALARGEEQLENLRKRAKQQSMSLASAESARLAKKEAALEEWHAARQATMESKRAQVAEQQSKQSNKGELMDAKTMTTLGVIVAGFTAWAASPPSPPRQEMETTLEREDDVLQKANVDLPDDERTISKEHTKETASLKPSGTAPLPWTATTNKDKELAIPRLEANMKAAPIDIPEMPTKEERMKAMDEYIESIDGGNAWLHVLSEMIDED